MPSPLYCRVFSFVQSRASVAALLGTLGVSLFLWLGASGCSELAKKVIQEPKINLDHIALKDLGTNGATVLVGVQVDNPNPFNLRVDSLKYQLEIGGKLITESELPGIAEVEGHGSKVIEIPVPVKFQDLFSSALDFLSKSSSNYHVKGEARFGLLTVPFDKTGDLKLK